MGDDLLPPSLPADPFERIAAVIATTEALEDARRQLQAARLDAAKAQSEAVAARASASSWIGRGRAIALWITVAVVALTVCCALYARSLISQADAAREDADLRMTRVQHAEGDAYGHTFGAHFERSGDGWFIDFPPPTALRITQCRARTCVQVLPHGH